VRRYRTRPSDAASRIGRCQPGRLRGPARSPAPWPRPPSELRPPSKPMSALSASRARSLAGALPRPLAAAFVRESGFAWTPSCGSCPRGPANARIRPQAAQTSGFSCGPVPPRLNRKQLLSRPVALVAPGIARKWRAQTGRDSEGVGQERPGLQCPGPGNGRVRVAQPLGPVDLGGGTGREGPGRQPTIARCSPPNERVGFATCPSTTSPRGSHHRIPSRAVGAHRPWQRPSGRVSSRWSPR